MAKFVIKGGTVVLNGVDVSEHIRSVDVKRSKAQVDSTGLNGNGVEEMTPGLAKETFEFEVMADFDPGQIDDTLSPLYENETEFDVLVRPFAGAAGAGNPEFSGSRCHLFDYDPISGQIGQLSTTKVMIVANGGIARTA